jgi:PrtD family type I secretion system ABC transporter
MRAKDAKARGRQKSKVQLIRGMRGFVVFLFAISGIINVLALTGSFYMLQIYDRALASGSIPTLAALSILAIGLYFFQGLFDIIRSQVLVRIGARVDRQLAPLAHEVAIDMPRFGYTTSEALERGRDVDTVRSFLGSQGPAAMFDLPWVPLFLIFVYLLHPALGALTIAGAFILTCIAITTEVLTRSWASAAHQATIQRNAIADSNTRNSEILKAMGFAGQAVKRFHRANDEHLTLQTRTSDISGTFGAVSRVLRMMLQSAVLGLAAYLTIIGELSAGAIIAATIASARAMAPIDAAIGNWKQFVAARMSWGRVRETVTKLMAIDAPMELPPPARSLKVEGITVASPGAGRVLLSDVTFQVEAGKAVGVVGPSGGGKSTLARALTGIWPVLRGAVRLDDAELAQYGDAALGKSIGYLPQDVSLLDATIAENIARLQDDADPAAIVAAAQEAAVHEMIVRMPEGYQAPMGPQGVSLSGGERQRIGLARALYGKPFIVVLDEPNSNLDAEGEAALTTAIQSVKKRGGIVVVIAHRPSALAAVDYVAVVQNGRMTAFGPKEEILNARTAQVASGPRTKPAAEKNIPEKPAQVEPVVEGAPASIARPRVAGAAK